MKDNVSENNLVEAEASVQGAEAQKDSVGTAETRFGKFKSVDALLDAYNSLEAEFTRRSQRLKELEGKAPNGNIKAVEEPRTENELNNDNLAEASRNENLKSSVSGKTDTAIVGPSAEGNAVKSANGNESKDVDISEELRTRIISQYLSKIHNNAPNVLAGGGAIVGAPKVRAKTLEDAAKQATEIFKNNRL